MSGDRTPPGWTPPARVWAYPAYGEQTHTSHHPVAAQPAVEYVLASRLAEVERERDRLRAKGLDDFTVTADEHERLLDERDALRARVEELEAGLRDAASALADASDSLDHDGWQRAASDAHVAHHAARALLSGGSQEPRPEPRCSTCDDTGMTDNPTGDGPALVGCQDCPEEPSPDTHTAECEHHAFMHHAATGGDAGCVCPRPDTDETCPARAGANDDFRPCVLPRGHDGDHLSDFGDAFRPATETCPDCGAVVSTNGGAIDLCDCPFRPYESGRVPTKEET